MGINSFTFDDKNSLNLGVYTTGRRTFSSPKRGNEFQQIPGRNGAAIHDYGYFENIEITYESVLIDDRCIGIGPLTSNLKAYLLSHGTNYYRLEDTYQPYGFRLGCFIGPIDIETYFLEAGSCDLTFNCMPQLFLKDGERAIAISATNTEVYNPYLFTAEPIMQLTCTTGTSGTFGINGRIISISNANTKATLIYDARDKFLYSSDGSAMGVISSNTGNPVLDPGNNTVIFTGGVRSINIIPRWWTL